MATRGLRTISTVPLSLRVFYGVFAREGFGASEAAALRSRDVDFDRGFLSLDKNTADDPRAWPMSEENEARYGHLKALSMGHRPMTPRAGSRSLLISAMVGS